MLRSPEKNLRRRSSNLRRRCSDLRRRISDEEAPIFRRRSSDTRCISTIRGISTEVLHLLESPEALKAKVAEAMDVLRSVAQQQAGGAADQLASLSLGDNIVP